MQPVSKSVTVYGKVVPMARKEHGLARTKWRCKYHIVLPPKYKGQYVSTAGLNAETIAKHIREQEAHDQAMAKLGVKECADPFKK